MENNTSWNIIFLIYAELTNDATDDDMGSDEVPVIQQVRFLEQELRQLPVFPSVNLFYIKNTVRILDDKVISDHTTISRLIKGRSGNGSSFKKIAQSSHKNFGQKYRCVAWAFKKATQSSPADKTVLVTWDHGSVFGIFKRTVSAHETHAQIDSKIGNYRVITSNAWSFELVRNKPLLRPSVFYKTSDLWLKERIRNQTSIDILSMDRLADAIREGIKGGVVEALVMYNCNMQNMHTCFSLKDQVRYLLAPEATIASPGYDFRSLVNFIGANNKPELDGGMIMVKAIADIKDFYQRCGRADVLDRYALFGLSLCGYQEKVIAPMKKFVALLRQMMQDNIFKENLRIVRSKSFAFAHELNYEQVDLINFLTKLSEDAERPEITLMLEWIRTTYEASIFARSIGKEIYPPGDGSWGQWTNTPPNGVSIYYPENGLDRTDSVAQTYIMRNAPLGSGLMAEIGWIDFLEDLIPTISFDLVIQWDTYI